MFLKNVMLETSITTSMVFIILIGAAMLTAAFRGFGGEEIVKDFLNQFTWGILDTIYSCDGCNIYFRIFFRFY